MRRPDRQGGRALARRADAGRARAGAKCRRCRARAPASSISRRPRRGCSTMPRRSPRRPATASSRSSGCCSRWRWRRAPRRPKILANAGVTPQTLNARDRGLRKGRTADSASAENAYDALKKYARDLTEAARAGKLDPVIGRDEEIRRTIQVLSPPHQEQSRADRRARRRQDRHRRGPRAAHRQRRRAGIPARQEAAVARHGLADRRREISRRVRGAAEGRAQRSDGGRGRHHPVHRRDAHAGRRRQGATARWTPPTC